MKIKSDIFFESIRSNNIEKTKTIIEEEKLNIWDFKNNDNLTGTYSLIIRITILDSK